MNTDEIKQELKPNENINDAIQLKILSTLEQIEINTRKA
jgi:hypothetical protein